MGEVAVGSVVPGPLPPLWRCRLLATLGRLHHEFWPPWVFYLPLLPWLGWLTLRYGSLTHATAANPTMPSRGLVGESKAEILGRLPADAAIPWALLEPGPDSPARLEKLMAERGWSFPLVLKPDAGQRGAGVRLVRDAAAAGAALATYRAPVLVQTYHPGPFEAGVFYVRLPGEVRGHLFSITDKHFPEVTGDGRQSLRELIWRHPRLRLQARTFLARLGDEAGRVPGAGETVRLGMAGNHCQGTMFADGAHLSTPALEARVDAIARAADLCFGRFDVRYGDPEAFRRGEDLAIVELNGILAESTNLYDPRFSLAQAYGILFRQWAWLARIGAAQVAAGHRPLTWREVWRRVRTYYRDRRVELLAD